jgi:protein pelota
LKILENNIGNDELKIRIETLDDLWYIKNLLEPGDLIVSDVFRRVELNDDMDRAKSTERKKIKVKLKVEKVDFQPYTDKIKILGEIIEGDEAGSHQSIFLGTDDEFLLIKEFTDEDLNLLREATDTSQSTGIYFISMDDEEATVCALRPYGIQELASIKSGKSGKYFDVKQQSSGYYQEIEYVLKNIRDIIILIILGPGFEHSKFYNFINQNPYFKNFKKYDFAVEDTGKRGIYEFLGSEKSENILKNSRLVRDEKIINKFLEGLNKSATSIYGYGDILKYAQMGIIQDLIISEEKFHAPETRELLSILNGSANIHVISRYSDSGEIIKKFGGYCAILRYSIK